MYFAISKFYVYMIIAYKFKLRKPAMIYHYFGTAEYKLLMNKSDTLTSVACHRLAIAFGREREVLGDGLPANDDNAEIQKTRSVQSPFPFLYQTMIRVCF